MPRATSKEDAGSKALIGTPSASHRQYGSLKDPCVSFGEYPDVSPKAAPRTRSAAVSALHLGPWHRQRL